MSITKSTIQRQFNVKAHQVEQESSKQAFVVHLPEYKVFVSYTTIVGITHNGDWYFTNEKHSVTTSQQVGAFWASRTYLPEAVFDRCLKGNWGALADYNKSLELQERREQDFKEAYHNCIMYSASVSPELLQLAKALEPKIVNRLVRELIEGLRSDKGATFALHVSSISKKLKIKLNKAIKGA